METKGKGQLYVHGVAYGFDTIIEDNKVIEIDFPSEFYKVSHPVYLQIESEFNEWIETQYQDIKDMYFLPCEEMEGKTYYSKKAAIHEGLNVLYEYMIEMKFNYFYMTEKNLSKLDFAAVFQP